MKIIFEFLFALLIGIFIMSCRQQSIIELPITVKNGYGPFMPSFSGLFFNFEYENNPWKKTYLHATGIPDNWTDVKTGAIDTDIRQMVYQNYRLGKISQNFYEELQKSWQWTPDTLNLSEEPIKCRIAFVVGKDASGKTKMLADTNNNLDFGDDAAFSLLDRNLFYRFLNLGLKDSIDKYTVTVSYERLSKNKIVSETIPMIITDDIVDNLMMANFYQHATARLDSEEIAICSAAGTSYDRINVVTMNDNLRNGEKVNLESAVSNDEYLTIKGTNYKIKGVNRNKNVLMLEKTDLPSSQLYSTQIGFKTLPFEGRDFRTNEIITPDQYKGKYLLLDFWAVWCAPCIHELPTLKALYDKSDRSKLEFVGILGHSTLDAAKEITEKYAVTWPQIVSDDTDNIVKNYNIYGFPTTLLIDPDGVIIAKNLMGKALEDKINEIIAP